MEHIISKQTLITIFVCSWIMALCIYIIELDYRGRQTKIYEKHINDRITCAEYGYFLGQRDAIYGDIAIKLNRVDSVYVWVKSPWDSGKKPKFKPMRIDTE